MFVASDYTVQIEVRTLEFLPQWQRRVEVRHGAVDNTNAAESVRGCQIGGSKR